jgi:anaerobic selenocysteine-containing dehydrogenase
VLHPLKRTGSRFDRISWDQAISEISEKLRAILGQYGPRSLVSLVGGGEFSFLSAPFAARLVRRLGSRYNYSSANQEFSGRFWAHGLTLGNQGIYFTSDFENCDVLMLVGKNPMMSHHFPQARRRLTKMSKDPDRLLVVVDPRPSETARIANIHLAIRPGTDALLVKSMISIILNQGLYNREYIAKYADGFNEVLPWFADFDAKAALTVCNVDYGLVTSVCREFATSYLLVVLLTICGRIGMPGGNYMEGRGTGPDPNDPRVWRTVSTDIPALNGMFPPNVLPEEIINDHPDRVRAVLTCAANPLRSYADTTAYENAFKRLDLLVAADIVMSETASIAHYILPCKTAFESWEGTVGDGFSKVYARMRAPVVEAEGEQKESGEIFTLLAEAMGLIPRLPESLYEAARSGNFKQYGEKLTSYMIANPESVKILDFMVAKTLGSAIGSAHLASIFPVFMQMSKARAEEAARAGFPVVPDQGLAVHQAVISQPEGVLVGVRDPERNIETLTTKNERIRLYNPEVSDWIRKITPVDEEEKLKVDERFPLIGIWTQMPIR